MENHFLGRSRSGVGVGVGVDIFSLESELESESLKIHRLRSPGFETIPSTRSSLFQDDLDMIRWWGTRVAVADAGFAQG